MNLYLLRHGLAAELGEHGVTKDAERALTPKGKAKLSQIAAAMGAQGLSFDLILSSPYVRARQTAEIVAEALGMRKRVEFTEALVPGGQTRKLVDLLRLMHPNPREVLLVGHEPLLSDLISVLVAGGPGLPVVMKKGGLCKLSAETLEHGRCAALEWLLTPKQMLLMS